MSPVPHVQQRIGAVVGDAFLTTMSTLRLPLAEQTSRSRHSGVVSVTLDRNYRSDLATGADAEIEEEGRLLYGAMTRARNELHLVVPRRFFSHGQSAYGDRHVYAAGTQFIPDELLGLFNRSAWPAAAAEPAAAGPARQLFGLTSAPGYETCGAEAGRLAVGHIRNDAPRK